ncbi:PDDEXK nuclease domain-containing protein [Chitinophaga sedimenti]|uniref:PDDEXK nuclease domain-containing protein n=1 Tax=Chitinophaga sedimenti TaxID=2033606 RepID=UPI002005455C|nr:PDDEXK nuclease domain-containing protein [Chitinophaga sedimenti]MCK7555794.1 PDDEXK nuclease domain-containing protein [Chitinophaga sedimenti]
MLSKTFVSDIKQLLHTARNAACRAVNVAMVHAYWGIGKRIVEEEQKGADRADYGAALLQQLAEQLTKAFGKGFDERELRRIRQFYQAFPFRDALRPELSWTHYRILLRVDDGTARAYYARAAVDNSRSSRQLERNISTKHFERLLVAGSLPAEPGAPEDIVRDPYILEFLGLDDPAIYSESDIESAIIANIQSFLLELGTGFCFVARQYRIKTETKQFYIDLVFYHYILKCFVLIDLKVTELTHQDIGQMDMYVRMFEDLKRRPDDQPTIGIILCKEKDQTIVKYSVLEESKHLFASSYSLVLPSEDDLKAVLEQDVRSRANVMG